MTVMTYTLTFVVEHDAVMTYTLTFVVVHDTVMTYTLTFVVVHDTVMTFVVVHDTVMTYTLTFVVVHTVMTYILTFVVVHDTCQSQQSAADHLWWPRQAGEKNVHILRQYICNNNPTFQWLTYYISCCKITIL